MILELGVTTGTFDPPTLGHLDLIKNAANLCKKLIIILSVPRVKKTFFTIEERANLLKDEIERCELTNIEVITTEDLVIDYIMKMKEKPNLFIRGVRNIKDCSYEMDKIKNLYQATLQNIQAIITLLLPSHEKYYNISSTLVRERIVANENCSDLASSKIELKTKQRMETFFEILEEKETSNIISLEVYELLSKKATSLLKNFNFF